jgi:hypothetical protein
MVNLPRPMAALTGRLMRSVVSARSSPKLKGAWPSIIYLLVTSRDGLRQAVTTSISFKVVPGSLPIHGYEFTLAIKPLLPKLRHQRKVTYVTEGTLAPALAD